jgi:hypothetical protein
MTSPTSTDTQPVARKVAWQERLGCLGCCLAPLVVACLLVAVSVAVRRLGLSPYHAEPSPTGMIARFELPPAHYITGAEVVVHGHEPMVIEVRHGSAWKLFFTVDEGAVAEPAADPIEVVEFDFDGDGTVDRIETDSNLKITRATVRVVCGASGDVLFSDSDPMDMTTQDRAIALPDLDGDGASELALYHPRVAHPGDLFDLGDRWVDVKSWLTIVSYAPE